MAYRYRLSGAGTKPPCIASSQLGYRIKKDYESLEISSGGFCLNKIDFGFLLV
jgi:hypothetical protein